VVNKGYENCLLLLTKAIDKIMTGGEDLQQEDLVISKLLSKSLRLISKENLKIHCPFESHIQI
jgi:hypothetical protein